MKESSFVQVEFSFSDIGKKLADIPKFSGITNKELPEESGGLLIIKAIEEPASKKTQTARYKVLLMCFARCLFCEFESFLGDVVGLDENDIQLIFQNFMFHFLSVTNYLQAVTQLKTFKRPFTPWGSMHGPCNLKMMITGREKKLALTRSAGSLGTLKYDEKDFFKIF